MARCLGLWHDCYVPTVPLAPRPRPRHHPGFQVAGFTVAHDVSARDWQLKKNGGQWLLGAFA